jgi:BASS family bile acid:Na+ symporter
MTVAQLIPLVVQLSIILIVFCVGLKARFQDIGYLLGRPGMLIRSLLAMNVIMPIVAVGVALAFDLNPAVEAALIAMALAPVPPILPTKEAKAGGAPSYIIGMLAAAALFSIVFVPAAAELVGRIFERPVHVSAGAVAKIALTSVLAPLMAGVCVALLAPKVAGRMARPLSILGTVLLAVAVVPILVAGWHEIAALFGNYTIVAIVAFVLVGLGVGHVLGGPDPDERTVLALSTATRHPAVAMAIAQDAVEKPTLLAAVILVLLVGAIVSGPYVKWRRRLHAGRT